jgi:hypothetical protein
MKINDRCRAPDLALAESVEQEFDWNGMPSIWFGRCKLPGENAASASEARVEKGLIKKEPFEELSKMRAAESQRNLLVT